MSALGTDCGLLYGFGTYSIRDKEEAASLIGISATKSISDAISISYNYSLGLDDAMDDAV